MKHGWAGIGLALMAGLMVEANSVEENWYRGNTHTHTFWSDGNHFAEMAAAWYKANGYQFVVLTDHNRRPVESGWTNLRKYRAYDPAGKLAQHFGDSAVVTKQDGEGNTLHRMLSYDEVAELVDVPGKFAAVPGEELTNRAGSNPVHMSAINTVETIGVKRATGVLETAQADAARVRAHEKKHNRPVFLQLNHPNWRWDMTAEVLAATTDADAFELVNPGCHNLGDEHSPSTERLWDIAATLRIKKYNTQPIWAVCADDTHNYHDFEVNAEKANPGRAFVMVRAPELSGNAIAQALKDGDFHASTGIRLKTVRFDRQARELTIEIDPADEGTNYEIQFVGTPKTVSVASTPSPAHSDLVKKTIKKEGRKTTVDRSVSRSISRIYSEEIGKVLEIIRGKRAATFKLPDDLLYVRCKVVDTSHPGHTWKGETIPRAAWTQPVGWRSGLAEQLKDKEQ
jgi:hypothetical protein